MLYIVVMGEHEHNILHIDESRFRTDLERQLWAERQWQAERIVALEKRVGELETLLAKALKNSSTSSKPPSSDIVKPPKPPSSSPGGKRKQGAQPGHPKHERTAFGPDEIASIEVYEIKECPMCHVALIARNVPSRVVQQVEVVPAQTVVIEHQAKGGWCPLCEQMYYAPLPPAVEKGGLVGPILTAQIAYMKSALHASFTSIRKYVRDTMGLTLSRGQLSNIIQKVSAALEGPYEELQALLRSEDILNVDETGHKDNGDHFWTWCFRAADYAVFKVSASRGSDVLLDVLGQEFKGTLGCDFFSAYRKYMKDCGIHVQFCLAHFIRDVKFLMTLSDAATVAYGQRLLRDLRALFYIIHRHDEVEPAVFTYLLEQARELILAEAQDAVPPSADAQRIAKRLRAFGKAYFEFITTPGLEPTNNLAEQAIRFVTIDRHITQGTRGENGCRWSERIWTILATCTLQGRSAFDYLVDVIQADFNGQPVPSLVFTPP
jgi:transposase